MASEPYDSPLREIKIEVTHRCPLSCVHCSSEAGPTCAREMSAAKCLEILQEAVGLGARKIAFSGGEPLLWPGLDDVVEYASSTVAQVVIYTTGCVKDVHERFRVLQRKGVEKAVFSVFGPDAPSHEDVTRKAGSLEGTRRAIAAANSAGIETEIHFVPLCSNFRRLREVAELGRELGVSCVSVLRFVPQGRGELLPAECLGRLENMELRKTILELRGEGYSVRAGSPYRFLMLADSPACKSGVDRLIVAPDLRLYPCDAFKQIRAEDIVGDARLSSLEDCTLAECWSGSPYLTAVRASAGTSPTCMVCSNLARCGTGCPAQKFLAYRQLGSAPDPMCLMSRTECSI